MPVSLVKTPLLKGISVFVSMHVKHFAYSTLALGFDSFRSMASALDSLKYSIAFELRAVSLN